MKILRIVSNQRYRHIIITISVVAKRRCDLDKGISYGDIIFIGKKSPAVSNKAGINPIVLLVDYCYIVPVPFNVVS